MPTPHPPKDKLFAQKSKGQSENDKLLDQNWKVWDGKVNAEMSSSWHKNRKVLAKITSY